MSNNQMAESMSEADLAAIGRKRKEKQALKRKAELLWTLVTTTAGVADLAEPMKRAEHHFDRLSQRQRITVAVIASQFDKGCNEINAQTQPEVKPAETPPEVVVPDAIIPPDKEGEDEGEDETEEGFTA